MGEYDQPVIGMKSCSEFCDAEAAERQWSGREWFSVREAQVYVSPDNTVIPCAGLPRVTPAPAGPGRYSPREAGPSMATLQCTHRYCATSSEPLYKVATQWSPQGPHPVI